MALFLDSKKASYHAQRAISQGAGITLVAAYGEYRAHFECATRIAEVLGTRDLQDKGDGLLEVIPFYSIPLQDLNGALQKLTTRFSIALVDYVCDNHGGRFVLLWRILPTSPAVAVTPITYNLDEF